MWNYLVGGLLVGRDGRAVRRQRRLPGPGRAVAAGRRAPASPTSGTGAPYLVACMKAGLRRPPSIDLSAAARHRLDRVAAAARGVPLGLRATGRGAGPACSARSPAAPTCAPASSGRARCCRCGPGSSPGRCLGAKVEAFDADGQAGDRRGRRAGDHRADAVDAGRLLERPRRRPVPGQLLRRLPGRLAARRLDHDPARRRLRHLRPLRRHPEPRRRADGHQRVLPRRRGTAGGRRQPGRRHRHSSAATGGWCCTWCRPRGEPSTTTLRSQTPRAAAVRSCRPGTCRTRSTRCPACRARCRARSSRCRCARSCSARRSPRPPTRTRWPTRKCWPTSRRRTSGHRRVRGRRQSPGRSFGEEGGQLTYGSYLRVPELLAQQVPQVDPPAHDELLFITVHQVYELWFQQLLHELDRRPRRDGTTDADLAGPAPDCSAPTSSSGCWSARSTCSRP